MKICFQAFFCDVSTTSAPLTSLNQNLFSTLLRKLCVHYVNGSLYYITLKVSICFQAFFRDVSTTSASLTSLKQNVSSTLLRKLCVHYDNGFDTT
jgi:hypothetical protein